MQASPTGTLPVLLVLLGIGGFIFWAIAALVRGILDVRLFLAVSISQVLAYLICFSVAFGYGDAGVAPPLLIRTATALLSAPLIYLMALPPTFFGNRWWGDDANFIVGLAIINSAVWGLAATLIAKGLGYKRRRAG